MRKISFSQDIARQKKKKEFVEKFVPAKFSRGIIQKKLLLLF